jgi:hypothetical protein
MGDQCRIVCKGIDPLDDLGESFALTLRAFAITASSFKRALHRGKLQLVCSDGSVGNAFELIESWLAKFLPWDTVRFEEQRRAFASVYSPVTTSARPVLDAGPASDSRLPLEPLHLLRLLSDDPLPHQIDGGV